MSQSDFGTIDPTATSGTELAQLLGDFRDAVETSHSGTTRPSYVKAGMFWINNAGSPWLVNVYDGAFDIEIGTINPSTHVFVPFGVTPKNYEETVITAPKGTFTITGGYRAGAMRVFQNGARLKTTDFTATNGTSVALGANAAVGDDMLFEWFD
jgi:hypothetical protein